VCGDGDLLFQVSLLMAAAMLWRLSLSVCAGA
jgi:hypothetical protein